jgi:hypothetical protein
MKISGFTIIKNAVFFDFPIIESITSLLDLVDEFIIVAGDSIDNTNEVLASINSPKVKIINTVWDTDKYKNKSMVYAHQTDIGLKACTGDWCFYIQSDEVLHEDSIPAIRNACSKYLSDTNVEGFLLKYIHLYGDYEHYIDNRHFGYPREIRIVRNLPDMHSWRDAKSFRIISNFDYVDYWQKKNTKKLNCILLDAYIFHYGWSRDPRCMVKKMAVQGEMYSGQYSKTQDLTPKDEMYFKYDPLNYYPKFIGTHPKVMQDRIKKISWKHLLHYEGKRPNIGKMFGLKYRILTFIENNILPEGAMIGGFKNHRLLKKEN